MREEMDELRDPEAGTEPGPGPLNDQDDGRGDALGGAPPGPPSSAPAGGIADARLRLLEEAVRSALAGQEGESELPEEVQRESPAVQALYRRMTMMQDRLEAAEAEAETERLRAQMTEGFSRLAAKAPGSEQVLEELAERIPQIGAAVARIPLMEEIVSAYIQARMNPAGQVPGQRDPVQVVGLGEGGEAPTAQGRQYARKVAASGVMSEDDALAIWGRLA